MASTTETTKYVKKAPMVWGLGILAGLNAYQAAYKPDKASKGGALIGATIATLITVGVIYIITAPITENIKKTLTTQ